MFQFSFYIRHCPSKENADVHIKRVKSFIPTDGVVGLLCVTDKQFGAMELFQGKSEKNLPIGSQQLELFWLSEIKSNENKKLLSINDNSFLFEIIFVLCCQSVNCVQSAVNYTQRYKKWKQFTTGGGKSPLVVMLWTIHKDTKNESNSQRYVLLLLRLVGCELYTKIQKMKAIHNHESGSFSLSNAVNYTQRYKKWKQFTTFVDILKNVYRCELYTKIQKMKAIHNGEFKIICVLLAVNYTQRYKKWKQFTTCHSLWSSFTQLWTIHKDTKNESNSQQVGRLRRRRSRCELYTKIQKMKAIHNPKMFTKFDSLAVNYTQRYKKWKQFTTFSMPLTWLFWLWTIHKDTKNESNSQQTTPRQIFDSRCELYTKIQKMKAIHN